MFLLIPYQHFVKEWMSIQQGLIALADEEVDLGIGIEGMQLFDDAGSQHYVTNKRCLYDKKFLHDANLH